MYLYTYTWWHLNLLLPWHSTKTSVLCALTNVLIYHCGFNY